MDDQKNSQTAGLLTGNSSTRGILFWMAILVMLGLGGALVSFALEGMEAQFAVTAIGLAPILIAFELNRRGRTQAAGIVAAVGLTLMITLFATLGGGIRDISVMGFPAILILASLILQRKATLLLTVFTIACTGWLVFGNIYGLYQPQLSNQVFPRQFFLSTLILVMTASAVQILSNALRRNETIIQWESEQRRKTDQALRRTEELYRNMVEKTSVITYRDTAETESSTIYISPQIQAILGYSQTEWQETPRFWMTIIHPQDLPDILAKIEEYLRTGENAISEYRMRAKDGRWVWFRDESVVIKDEAEKPQYIHGVLIDITEQKLAEAKLHQREAILSAVAQTAQQLLRSTNWREEINEILRLLGEATGASHVYIFENHPAPDGNLLSSQRYEWTAPGMESELHNPVYQNTSLLPTTPGLEDWYGNLSTGRPFYGSGKQYPRYWRQVFETQGLQTLLDVPIYAHDQWWGIIGFDDYAEEMPWSQAEIDALMAAAGNLGTAISRQQVDTALRASEEKFQLAFHHTFVPMIISRAQDEKIMDVNQAFCSGTGYSREEIIGRTAVELDLWVSQEDRLRHQQILARQGFQEEFKTEFRQKNGQTGVALISAITVHIGQELCLLHTVYDISKIDNLLNELQAKNEELQNFAYTVSHDLRAPLITIAGFLGYLEQDVQSGKIEKIQKDILRLNEAVSKMQRLLRELLELSRIGRLMNSPEVVPFVDIIEEALQLLEGRLTAAQITVQVQSPLPNVFGDHIRLVEVVQNLVDNSAKFMGGQTSPRIEIGTRTENGTPVFFVRDNGIGIEPDQQQRVFELFTKLDAGTEGTGVGLALVKRIVEVHGGRIWIDSEGKGKGTTFLFTLADSPQQGTP